MQPFDPYHIWLGIPANLHPLNLYQLLGLQTFETDINVIVNAADQRMAHVKSFANGPYGPQSQQLLNELSQAKLHLIDPQLRTNYDAQLYAAIAQAQSLAAQVPTAIANPAPVAEAQTPVAQAPITQTPVTQIPTVAPIDHVVPETSRIQPAVPATAEALPSAKIPTVEPLARETLDLAAHPLAHLERDPSLTSSATNDSEFDFKPTSGVRHKKSKFPVVFVGLISAGIALGLLWIFVMGDSTIEEAPIEALAANASGRQDAPAKARQEAPRSPKPAGLRATIPTPDRPPAKAPAKASSEATPQPPSPPRNTVGSSIGDIADTSHVAVVAATPPAKPVDPIAAAIGGIGPVADDGKPDEPEELDQPEEPKGAFGTDDEVEESTPTAPTEVMPKTVKPLPRDFFASIGKAFVELQANQFETYAQQRDKVRGIANQTNNASALVAIAQLEQMEYSRAKLWELVNLAVGSLSATQEITTQSGAIAAVIEASPQKLVLRASGASRRYLVERRGPSNIFPSMSPKLVVLLAGLVDERSPQAEKALAFHRGLANVTIPDDPEQAWNVATNLWSDGGETPPQFFGIPATANDGGEQAGTTTVVVEKPESRPGYHVARFQCDGRAVTPETIKVPANLAGDPKLEITRIYLGPTLGLRKPSTTNRYVTTRSPWSVDGDSTKLSLQLKSAGDDLQLRTGGMYRRNQGSRFRFEPLSLTRIAVQGKAAVSGLKKKRIDVSSAVATTLSGRTPLGLLTTTPDMSIEQVIDQIGNLPSDVSQPLVFVLRLQQIRDFAKELQEQGWVELKFVAE